MRPSFTCYANKPIELTEDTAIAIESAPPTDQTSISTQLKENARRQGRLTWSLYIVIAFFTYFAISYENQPKVFKVAFLGNLEVDRLHLLCAGPILLGLMSVALNLSTLYTSLVRVKLRDLKAESPIHLEPPSLENLLDALALEQAVPKLARYIFGTAATIYRLSILGFPLAILSILTHLVSRHPRELSVLLATFLGWGLLFAGSLLYLLNFPPIKRIVQGEFMLLLAARLSVRIYRIEPPEHFERSEGEVGGDFFLKIGSLSFAERPSLIVITIENPGVRYIASAELELIPSDGWRLLGHFGQYPRRALGSATRVRSDGMRLSLLHLPPQDTLQLHLLLDRHGEREPPSETPCSFKVVCISSEPTLVIESKEVVIREPHLLFE